MCVTVIARSAQNSLGMIIYYPSRVNLTHLYTSYRMCNIKTIDARARQSPILRHSLSFLSGQISRVDEECINALTTLEYLSLLSQVVPTEKSTDIVLGQPHQGTRHHHVADTSAERASKCSDPAELLETTPINEERIHSMFFSFDTLSILPKCQQAELLFSMFADGWILGFFFFFSVNDTQSRIKRKRFQTKETGRHD